MWPKIQTPESMTAPQVHQIHRQCDKKHKEHDLGSYWPFSHDASIQLVEILKQDLKYSSSVHPFEYRPHVLDKPQRANSLLSGVTCLSYFACDSVLLTAYACFAPKGFGEHILRLLTCCCWYINKNSNRLISGTLCKANTPIQNAPYKGNSLTKMSFTRWFSSPCEQQQYILIYGRLPWTAQKEILLANQCLKDYVVYCAHGFVWSVGSFMHVS